VGSEADNGANALTFRLGRMLKDVWLLVIKVAGWVAGWTAGSSGVRARRRMSVCRA